MVSTPSDLRQTGSAAVRYVEIDEKSAGQRLDNFLIKVLKGVPRSLVYRILRKGEVRVNKKRAKPLQKLRMGDSVRIPPVRLEKMDNSPSPSQGLQALLSKSIVYEDEQILVINKPSGLAVHGGSGLSTGLIESLRLMEVGKGFLELVHRLDRETSGCLMLAKKRSALVAMHALLRAGKIQKTYKSLVVGRWPRALTTIDAPLQKNTLSSGERMVRVEEAGKQAITHFRVAKEFATATLLDVDLDTGRTHQIRVHAQLANHPVMGDSKYGSKQSQQQAKALGLKRLFLHASRLEFVHPTSDKPIRVESPLPEELNAVLKGLQD